MDVSQFASVEMLAKMRKSRMRRVMIDEYRDPVIMESAVLVYVNWPNTIQGRGALREVSYLSNVTVLCHI